MTKRAPRRDLSHPGIKLLQLKDGRHVARYVDPKSGKQVQVTLCVPRTEQTKRVRLRSNLNLTTEDRRLEWAHLESQRLTRVRGDRELELAQERERVAAGETIPEEKKLADAQTEFLDRYGCGNTKKNKLPPVRKFVGWLAEQGVDIAQKIVPGLVARYRDVITAPKWKAEPGTRNRYLTECGIFLRWLHGLELLHPSMTYDKIKLHVKRVKGEHADPRVLSPQDVRDLLTAAIKHDIAQPKHTQVAPMLMLLLLSGMRVQEGIGLRWSEVMFGERCLKLSRERVKTRKGRTISWVETPTLEPLLRALYERRGTSMTVLPASPYSTWFYLLRVMPKYGGPVCGYHDLRRTCGTYLAMSNIYGGGRSLLIAAHRLGHSIAISERRYVANIDVHGVDEKAKTLEDVLGVRDLCEQIVRRCGGTLRSVAGERAGAG